MKYVALTFYITLKKKQEFEIENELSFCTMISEVLTAELADCGCEAFEEFNGTALVAYCQKSLYSEENVKQILTNFPIEGATISFKCKDIKDQDWNEEWEKNFFQPIVIGKECAIHSTFHKNIPPVTYDIIINPQMAFGTGHHETTSLILAELLKADLKGKRVLDMGCGTSILAILASMRGANDLVAIDIDEWCIRNSKENFKLNEITNIDVHEGDASLLAKMGTFDIVIANINRNILLADMPAYAKCLKAGSDLWISGFYTEDIACLKEKAESLGLTYLYHHSKNNWATVRFRFEQ